MPVNEEQQINRNPGTHDESHTISRHERNRLEIIELLLFQETGTNNENFKQKFEMLLNSITDLNAIPYQIDSTLHDRDNYKFNSPEFFSYLFLGSISTLLYTGLMEKRNIEKVFVRPVRKDNEIQALELCFITIKNEKKIPRIHLITINPPDGVVNTPIMENSYVIDNELKKILVENQINLKGITCNELEISISVGDRFFIRRHRVRGLLDHDLESANSGSFYALEKNLLNTNLDSDFSAMIAAETTSVEEKMAPAKKIVVDMMRIFEHYREELSLSKTEKTYQAFIYGAIKLNFKARYTINCFINSVLGKDFSPLIFTVNHRNENTIPIVVKFGEGDAQSVMTSMEKKGYALAPLQVKPMLGERILIAVSSSETLSVDVKTAEIVKQKNFFNTLSTTIPLFSVDVSDTRNEVDRIQQDLERIYTSIVDFVPIDQVDRARGRDKEHKNFLSRLIIGQLMASHLPGVNKYLFLPNDRNLQEQVASLVLKKRKKLVVFNIIEESYDSNFVLKKIPFQGLGLNEGNIYKIINIKITPENAQYGFKADEIGRSYCKEITISTGEVPSDRNLAALHNQYQGDFLEIKRSFDPVNWLSAIQEGKQDEITAQFSKLKNDLLLVTALIGNEPNFQAVMQGISMGMKDIIILTEINYSPQGRPDLAYHTIHDEWLPILVELKYFSGLNKDEADKKLEGGKIQAEKNSLLRAATKQDEAIRLVIQFNARLSNTIDFALGSRASIPHTSASESELVEDLFKAIRNKNLSQMQRLISKVDINKKAGKQRETALHLSVRKNFFEGMKLILNTRNLNLNIQDKKGQTAFFIAAEDGYLDIVNALIRKRVDVNMPDKSGYCPLLIAIEHKKFDIASAILDSDNVDVNVVDTNEDSVLHYLANNGDSEANFQITKQVVDKSNINFRNEVGVMPLHLVNSARMARFFINNGADLNAQDNNGNTPVHSMVIKDEFEGLKILLEEGAFFDLKNNDQKTPLMIYAEKHEGSAGHQLLQQIDNLFTVIKANQMKEVVSQLQSTSLDILTTVLKARNKDGLTVYHFAAAKGYFPILQQLTLEGAGQRIYFDAEVDEVALENAPNPERADVFIDAMDSPEAVRALESSIRTNLNIQDNTGKTPLHWASIKGNKEIVEYLIRKGVNSGLRDKTGKTALDYVEKQLAKNKDSDVYKSIKDLLLSLKTQKIESLQNQQKAFMRIGKAVKKIFPQVDIKAVRQGLYLPSFEKRNINIEGQCTSITRGFSQSLFLGQSEAFLNNLEIAAKLYERIASGQAVSARERTELFAFNRLLDRFQDQLDFPGENSLPSSLSPLKSIKQLDDLSHYISQLRGDFSINLVTGKHVVAIYRIGNTYTYFDSNVALVTDLASVYELMHVVREGVSLAGYEMSSEGVLIEHFDVTKANQALSAQDKAILKKPLQTERSLLALQDITQGPIDLNDQTLYRTTLYDMGAKLQLDDGPTLLINSQMKAEDIKTNLQNGKIKITVTDYLQKLQGKPKRAIQEILQATASINFSGTTREVETAKKMQAFISSEDGKTLNTYELNKLFKDAKKASLKTLPFYLAVAKERKQSGGGHLVNAAGRISMMRGVHSIIHAGLSGDEKEFYLGAGEIGFSFLSGFIENGIVKLTPKLIKQLKLGIIVHLPIRQIGEKLLEYSLKLFLVTSDVCFSKKV